ncbi:hypothetical protein, partial [Escherichia coli]
KMPAFEWVHVQLHQQKGMISLSPPTICNSAEGTTSHRVAKFNWLCGINRNAWWNECRYKSSYILRSFKLLSLPITGAFNLYDLYQSWDIS